MIYFFLIFGARNMADQSNGITVEQTLTTDHMLNNDHRIIRDQPTIHIHNSTSYIIEIEPTQQKDMRKCFNTIYFMFLLFIRILFFILLIFLAPLALFLALLFALYFVLTPCGILLILIYYVVMLLDC